MRVQQNYLPIYLIEKLVRGALIEIGENISIFIFACGTKLDVGYSWFDGYDCSGHRAGTPFFFLGSTMRKAHIFKYFDGTMVTGVAAVATSGIIGATGTKY